MKCYYKNPVETLLHFDYYSFQGKKKIYFKKENSHVLKDYQTTTYLQNNKKNLKLF